MDSQDKNNVAEFPAPGQELYLPFGATDPDFYIPADCDRQARGLSRWLRALPVFGRERRAIRGAARKRNGDTGIQVSPFLLRVAGVRTPDAPATPCRPRGRSRR
jgi:hypothetical protein